MAKTLIKMQQQCLHKCLWLPMEHQLEALPLECRSCSDIFTAQNGQEHLKTEHCASSLGQDKVGSSFLGVVNPLSLKGRCTDLKILPGG